MAKKQAAAKKESLKSRWKRYLITTGIVVLILYIGLHILSRTEGARTAIADKLSNGTRQQISIDQCGATPLMGLRLKGLRFQGVEMPDVKMSFNWFFFLFKEKPVVKQLHIEGLEIQFTRIPSVGRWEPLVLHGVGSRLGAVLGLNPPGLASDESVPIFPPRAINEKTLLQLERAKVVWRDEKGRDIAYITDADLRLKTGMFIKRKVIQTLVKCGHVKLASGRALRDFRLESFRIEGSDVVTILNMADSNGQYEEFASKSLWQDLNLHLHQLSEIK